MTVVCAREDLANAAREMLDQPRMKQAVLAAFPDALVESFPRPPSTLKLVQSRSPSPGILLKGDEAVIEYSDRSASSGGAIGHIQRELLKRALIETALSGLRDFVGSNSLSSACREEIQLFARGIARTEMLTQSEVKVVVSDVIRAEYDRLQRLKDKLFKKLREACVTAKLPADELEKRIDTASALTRSIMSISLLVDQPGAKPEKSEFRDKRDSGSRAKVVEELEKTVEDLALNPRGLWSRAIFDGDYTRADALAKLRQSLQNKFRLPGFNVAPPSLFTFQSPQSTATVQANIERLIRGSETAAFTTRAAPRFSPEILTNTSAYVTQALAVSALDRELRAWTTSDSDPIGLLREELLTISQQVPAALVELREKLPDILPGPVQDFLKTLCLLRLHGGVEGASYFASVACHHSQDEARTTSQIRRALLSAIEQGDEEEATRVNGRLQTHLSQIPGEHPDDYTSLVGFLAAWPLYPTTSEREIGLAPIIGRLTALATSVVYTNTKTLEESFLRNMSGSGSDDPSMLEQLGRDVRGLAEAAKVLSNPEVSSYMEPITESLSNLILVLQAETLEAQEQFKHFGRVKLAFEKQQALLSALDESKNPALAVDVTVRAIHDRIKLFYDSLVARLPEYGPSLRQDLSDLDQAGDIPAFTERIAEAIAVISALGPSQSSTELEKLIDGKVVTVVNLLSDAWEYEANFSIGELTMPTPVPRGLGFTKVSAALSAGTWPSTQLDALREVFAQSSLTNAAARVNHISAMKLDRRKQLTSALLEHPATVLDYLTTATERIANPGIRNQSMVEAAERFLDLHLDLRQPKWRDIRQARDDLQLLLTELKGALQTTPA